MGFDSIIALDLGKFNSVACLLDARTRRHRFETLATTPQTLHDFFAAHAGGDPQRTLIVVEACDVAAWVHDLAISLGLQMAVANTTADARGSGRRSNARPIATTPSSWRRWR